MARQLRIEFEGAVYHITSRGNAREKIFLDDADRHRFLDVLGKVVARFGWICHAYCLMSNHYHLLVETPDANLSRGMQLLNGIYTQSVNRCHDRSGHLLQGRYKSILVEKETHLLELARYVVLNPVRAKIARSAKDWRWSSYRATAGMADPPAFLRVDWILSQFDTVRKAAIGAYRRFVKQGRGVNPWDDLRAGYLLGSETFAERMRPMLQEMPLDPSVLRYQRDAAKPSLDDLFTTLPDKATRDERIREAVHRYHYKLREVGDHLGLHFSTISVIANRHMGASAIRK